MLSFKSGSRISVTNLTFLRTGHFAVLATDVEYLSLTALTMLPTRDCIDLVGLPACLPACLSAWARQCGSGAGFVLLGAVLTVGGGVLPSRLVVVYC